MSIDYETDYDVGQDNVQVLGMDLHNPVFFISAVLVIAFVAGTLAFPESANGMLNGAKAWAIEHFDWLFMVSGNIFVLFCIAIAVMPTGKIRLGGQKAKPEFSTLSWFAMLFSAGMGIGLMFYGVAEPIMHMTAPPDAADGTVDAAREAMRITFFHWGIHAWAIYAVVALSLAYFCFRQNLPLTIRSSLYPLIGERIYGPIGHAVDTFAVLGTLFGVATSLGLGVVQINSGLHYLLDVPNNSTLLQVGLIIAITGLATTSVVMGLDGGIRRVSELNLVLALVLMAFTLLAGPTLYLFQTFVQNTGHYLSSLVESTFNLYAYQKKDWIGGWTLFYWGWWIAWSPFVGMFIARISRGRTLREFIMGVLLVPTVFTFLWMTIFGNTAIHMVFNEGLVELSEAVSADTSVALFKFFEHLPFTAIASTLATVLIVTFFVTSSDSGSLVVDMLTSGGENEDTPVWQRIFWAVAEGAIAASLLLAGGLSALQTATIASALPFTIVMLLMCWGLFRALRLEKVKQTSLRDAMLAPRVMSNPVPWQKRLSRIVRQPSHNEVTEFMDTNVRPAMEQVAAEFSSKNIRAKVNHDQDQVWLEVLHGDEIDFFYSVHAKPYTPPSFVMRDTSSQRGSELRYYHAEVYLKEGGQDYSVMGWATEQLIADMIDQYEKHMHFLRALR